jgi:hypothetical protein
MIYVWIKNGEPRLYGNGDTDLITKTWLFLMLWILMLLEK